MKISTEKFINSLAQSDDSIKQLPKPKYIILILVSIILAYGFIVALKLGIRSDLFLQLHRPFFVLEILLLLSLICSTVFSTTFLLFPDMYQKKHLLYFPIYNLLVFILILVVQIFLPPTSEMIIPTGAVHNIECTLCITSIAIIPSALMFIILHKGASAHPFTSGTYAMLLASSIGCLLLRLAEENDSILHLVIWHYIPTLIFAAVGTLLGKIFLKW